MGAVGIALTPPSVRALAFVSFAVYGVGIGGAAAAFGIGVGGYVAGSGTQTQGPSTPR